MLPMKRVNKNDNFAELILTLRPGKPQMPIPPTGPCKTSQQHPKYTGKGTYSITRPTFQRLYRKYCDRLNVHLNICLYVPPKTSSFLYLTKDDHLCLSFCRHTVWLFSYYAVYIHFRSVCLNQMIKGLMQSRFYEGNKHFWIRYCWKRTRNKQGEQYFIEGGKKSKITGRKVKEKCGIRREDNWIHHEFSPHCHQDQEAPSPPHLPSLPVGKVHLHFAV